MLRRDGGKSQGTGQTLTYGGAILSSLKVAAGADEEPWAKGQANITAVKAVFP